MKQCIGVVFLTCMLALLWYREGSSAVAMFREGPNLLHTHFNVCGPNNGGISRWFWMWRRRTLFLLRSRRARLERAFQHLSISVLFLLPLRITRLRSQDDLWMRSAYQNRLLLCSFPTRCSLLLLLVSSLCCSWSAVKQTLRARCRKTLQCHWMSLFFVFERHLCPRSASGRDGETLKKTLQPAVVILHCLTFPWVMKITCEVFLFLCVCYKEKKWYFNNNSSLHLAFMVTCRCWVFRLCLFIKVKCWLVFYPRGSRVFVQACACPSDIWLCFNTVHELLFCGTWLAWIHFVYICTLILFTV